MQTIADADKIKRWREERLWSQEHVSEMAGISLRTLQRLEGGEQVSNDSLKALAAAFNVDVSALLIDLKQQAEQKRAGLRLSFWIVLASAAFCVILFAAISFIDGSGTYTMLVPTIWVIVGALGHGLAVLIVELAARYKSKP